MFIMEVRGEKVTDAGSVGTVQAAERRRVVLRSHGLQRYHWPCGLATVARACRRIARDIHSCTAFEQRGKLEKINDPR